MNDPEHPIIDLLLERKFAGKRAPDLRQRILRAAGTNAPQGIPGGGPFATGHVPADGHGAATLPPGTTHGTAQVHPASRGITRRAAPRRWIGIGLAAASVIAGVGMIVWPSAPRPVGVELSQGSAIELSDGWVELKEGWLIASARSGSIRAAGGRVDVIEGRALIKRGDPPTQQEIGAERAWLASQGIKEIDMLNDLTKWTRTGSMAVLLLAGSALIDGKLTVAEDAKYAPDDNPVPDKQADNISPDPATWPAVNSVADIEACSPDTRAVRLESNIGDAHIEFLSRLRSIEHLSTSASGITGTGIKQVGSAFPLLRTLSFKNPSMPEGFKFLKQLPSLERLSITGAGFRDSELETIMALPRLRELEVPRLYLTPEGDAFLKAAQELQALRIGAVMERETLYTGLASLTKLRELSTGVDGEAVGVIKTIAGLPSLVSLDLRGHVSDTHLAELAANGTIATLSLSGVENGGVLMTDAALKSLATMKALKELDLKGIGRFSDAGFAFLAKSQSLSTLSITAPTSRPGAACLQQVARIPALQDLNIYGFNNMAIRELAAAKGLRALYIYCAAGDNAHQIMEAAGKLPALTKLSVDGNPNPVFLDDRVINGLENLATLEDLIVKADPMLFGTGGADESSLSGALRLRRLAIYANGKSFAGSNFWDRIISAPAIDTITLYSCGIEDHIFFQEKYYSFDEPSWLSFFGRVTDLDLSFNHLTGASIESLARFKNLKTLNLTGNSFAGADQAKLRAALPNTKITF